MKIIIVVIFCILSTTVFAQKSYQALSITEGYQLQVNSGDYFGWNQGNIISLGYEYYSKKGIKIQAGIGYYAMRFSEDGPLYLDLNTSYYYWYNVRSRSLSIPILLSYNFLKKYSNKWQFFIAAGYNRQIHLRTTNDYNYDKFYPRHISTEKEKNKYGYIHGGLEGRYLFKKYFVGLGTSFSLLSGDNSSGIPNYSLPRLTANAVFGFRFK